MHRVNEKKHAQTRSRGVIAIAVIAAAVLANSCFLDTRTYLCESGRHCRPGQVCAANQDVCIDIGGCGDGVAGTNEACDDGNIIDGDGCSASCSSNEACGNGILDPGESCDDGRNDDGDSCSATCVLGACGNKSVDLNEKCDPGMPDTDTAACDKDCTFIECGDAHINTAADEDCDTGPGNPNTAACDGYLCEFSSCGNGYYNHEAGEDCDTAGNTFACNGKDNVSGVGNCKVPSCGDSYWNDQFIPPYPMSTPPSARVPEACDDGDNTSKCNGNDSDNDGSADNGAGSCQKPRCGDLYVNPQFAPVGAPASETELCDTGGVNTPACNGNNGGAAGPGSCRFPKCGDGYANSAYTPVGANPGDTEQCDTKGINTSQCNGNNNGSEGLGSCRRSSCGDGYWNPAYPVPSTGLMEQCDNGSNNSNTAPNACRTNCRMAYCGDGVADSGEQCRDKPGNCGTGQVCDDNTCKCIIQM